MLCFTGGVRSDISTGQQVSSHGRATVSTCEPAAMSLQ